MTGVGNAKQAILSVGCFFGICFLAGVHVAGGEFLIASSNGQWEYVYGAPC